MSVSVILVSYNTVDLTLKSLECVMKSIANSEFPVDIIVVDNASRDDSVLRIRAEYPSVSVIESSTNLGFGAANNLAALQATGEFVLLLNTDAFLESNALKVLRSYLLHHAAVAVVGPKILNADGSVQTSAWNFPSPLQSVFEYSGIGNLFHRVPFIGGYRKWEHNKTQRVPWLIGACILIRRAVFEDVGGFDDSFFMYAEETDFQKRIRNAGHEIHLCADTTVVHLGGGSGTLESESVRRYFYTSQDLYMRKHFGMLGLILHRIVFGLCSILRFMAWNLVSLIRLNRDCSSKNKAKLYAFTAKRSLTHWSIQ